MWNDAIGRMLERMEDTRGRVGNESPTGPTRKQASGRRPSTATGPVAIGPVCIGWPQSTPGTSVTAGTQAAALAQGLKNRVAVNSVFKSFPFYFGAVLGAILYEDKSAKDLALAGARSMMPMYNPALKLIPFRQPSGRGRAHR